MNGDSRGIKKKGSGGEEVKGAQHLRHIITKKELFGSKKKLDNRKRKTKLWCQ